MGKKKAISLIVLVITIIVMIILASAIILSLDNANIFNKAEEAVDKTNEKTNKYLSELKLAERELEKIQGASKVTDTTPGELSGKGTTEEPYLIESIEDLVAFSNRVNGGETFDGMTVKLTKLLDFNSDNSYVNPTGNDFGDVNGDGNPGYTLKQELTTGVGFKPIGTGTGSAKPFKGTFDGDGAEIRNIYIDIKDTNTEGTALIGYAEDAIIRNIGVTGKISSEGGTLGAIVGTLISTEKKSIIENCYSKVAVYGPSSGGIVGGAMGSSEDTKVVIRDCYNLGNISYSSMSDVSGGYLGGVIGLASFIDLDRCYNMGCVKNESDEGYSFTGGIIAIVSNSILKNSYNIGKVYAEYADSCGGIVAESTTNIIENTYNAGEIAVKIEEHTEGIGGCVGKGYDVIINNGYNIGNVREGNELIGKIYDNITLNKVYYKQSDIDPIGSGTPQGEAPIGTTLSQMKSQSFVDTLNKYITDNAREDLVKWKMGPNGYPTLDI